MKVLVTGHKGFIGSHVFDFLSDIFDVDGLDRPDDIETVSYTHLRAHET